MISNASSSKINRSSEDLKIRCCACHSGRDQFRRLLVLIFLIFLQFLLGILLGGSHHHPPTTCGQRPAWHQHSTSPATGSMDNLAGGQPSWVVCVGKNGDLSVLPMYTYQVQATKNKARACSFVSLLTRCLQGISLLQRLWGIYCLWKHRPNTMALIAAKPH